MFVCFKSSEEGCGADSASAPPTALTGVCGVPALPELPDWLRRNRRQQRPRRRAGVHTQEAADPTTHRAVGTRPKALLHGPLGDTQASARAPALQGVCMCVCVYNSITQLALLALITAVQNDLYVYARFDPELQALQT